MGALKGIITLSISASFELPSYQITQLSGNTGGIITSIRIIHIKYTHYLQVQIPSRANDSKSITLTVDNIKYITPLNKLIQFENISDNDIKYSLPLVSKTLVTNKIKATDGFIGNVDTATKLQTERNIVLSGDITGNAYFDGSKNITINTKLNNSNKLTNEDLNTIRDINLHCYYAEGDNTCANKPTNVYVFSLLVYGKSYNDIVQILTNHQNNKSYIRTCSAGAWSEWENIITQNDIVTNTNNGLMSSQMCQTLQNIQGFNENFILNNNIDKIQFNITYDYTNNKIINCDFRYDLYTCDSNMAVNGDSRLINLKDITDFRQILNIIISHPRNIRINLINNTDFEFIHYLTPKVCSINQDETFGIILHDIIINPNNLDQQRFWMFIFETDYDINISDSL